MSGWTVQLDPPAITGTRQMLDLDSGPIRVDQKGIDWGDAQITAYEAQEQLYGSTPISFRIPNRTVAIPLFLGADDSGGEEAARSQLQQKVALLQAEGGWLMRQRAGGPALYADVVNASLHLPDVWGETGGVEPDVMLTLECLPDFYGDEVALDVLSATAECHQVLKQSGQPAVIAGQYPGRVRIVVSDTSGQNQDGLLWALRARHYDAASTASLVYEAEALTPLNGASVQSLAGASGGQVVQLSNLPAGIWCPALATDLLSGSKLTHQGSYQVWARAYSVSGAPQLQLVWGVGSLAVPVQNDASAPLANSGKYYLVRLGVVRIDPPAVGPNQWTGVIQALPSNPGQDICIDKLILQPVDESAGRLAAVQPAAPPPALTEQESAGAGADDGASGTVAWTSPGSVVAGPGDATATVTAIAQATSHLLDCTGFGFAIPAAATILGITVQVMAASKGAAASSDARISLIKASAVQATNRAAKTVWPTTPAWLSYGSPSDLWGGSWAPADINSAGFGVAVAASIGATKTISSRSALIAAVRVTVTYQLALATGLTASSDVVVPAGGVCEVRWDGPIRQDPAGAPYAPVSQVLGDLPRLPPSGLESRQVELLVKPTRGDLDAQPDSGLDAFAVQVLYRPCYLGRT